MYYVIKVIGQVNIVFPLKIVRAANILVHALNRLWIRRGSK